MMNCESLEVILGETFLIHVFGITGYQGAKFNITVDQSSWRGRAGSEGAGGGNSTTYEGFPLTFLLPNPASKLRN